MVKLNGSLFAHMIGSGAARLGANRQIVNDLNVFPIPDGDTGDNMYMTMQAGADSILSKQQEKLSTVAAMAAQGMLLGARGNSGVILSRIFSGISKGFKDVDEATVEDFGYALACGVEEAYQAVTHPVEGTILTVYADAVKHARSCINENTTPETFFAEFLKETRNSLERTPSLLDVLRKAGVVDSGGAGFMYIAEGMDMALRGDASLSNNQSVMQQSHTIDLSKFSEDSVLEFGYCTEFLLRLQNSKVNLEHFDITEIRDYLNQMGDSLLVFQEGSIVKVHIHTKLPGDILNGCQRWGEYLTMKIENMTLQHNETHKEDCFHISKPKKSYGLVTVAAGKGVKQTFHSLGCDVVVEGGQSMNPSAESFLNAFRQINAQTILVFPNNSNIIMTANQAASMYQDADVRVIPTSSIGEGYGAISMLDLECNDTEQIIHSAEEAIAAVKTGMVSKACRNTCLYGVEVKKDDYIGFEKNRIHTDNPDRYQVCLRLMECMDASHADILIVLKGEAVPEQEFQELIQCLRSKYRRTEVLSIDGGQPVYDYLFILE